MSNYAPATTGPAAGLDAGDHYAQAGARDVWSWANPADPIEFGPSGPLLVSSPPELRDPVKKDIAMRLVAAATFSSLDWRAHYSYVEDKGDGRGYTAGIIGFCTAAGDLRALVAAYSAVQPASVLGKYLPALRAVVGTASHTGLDPDFPADWRTAADDPAFQCAQEAERDRIYLTPAVGDGRVDGVGALGQFAYYDAALRHGVDGMRRIRDRASRWARPPAIGGDEYAWLDAILAERVADWTAADPTADTSRVDTAQRVFLADRNFDLRTPLDFAIGGEVFRIE